ncbi:MAG: hypothetical protein LUE29_10965, partial [Lachnospiraceae bacterium]|nr:hypothetical protein [Lachnospiraceae bacterium]
MRKFWKKPVALFLCLALILATLGIQPTTAEAGTSVSVSLTVLQRAQGADETFTDSQSGDTKTASTYDFSAVTYDTTDLTSGTLVATLGNVNQSDDTYNFYGVTITDDGTIYASHANGYIYSCTLLGLALYGASAVTNTGLYGNITSDPYYLGGLTYSPMGNGTLVGVHTSKRTNLYGVDITNGSAGGAALFNYGLSGDYADMYVAAVTYMGTEEDEDGNVVSYLFYVLAYNESGTATIWEVPMTSDGTTVSAAGNATLLGTYTDMTVSAQTYNSMFYSNGYLVIAANNSKGTSLYAVPVTDDGLGEAVSLGSITANVVGILAATVTVTESGDDGDGDEETSVDKTELADLLAEAATKNEADYTEKSWGMFSWAVEYAQGIYDNADATQDEVDTAVMTLSYYMSELKENVDMTELQALYDEADALSSADYTEDSWTALQTAMDNAYGYLNGVWEADDQDEIDEVLAALQAAIDALVSVNGEDTSVDLSALEALVAEAEALDEADYTAASWSQAYISYYLQTANYILSMTEEELAEEEIDQEYVDQVVTWLQKAIDSLVVKIDVSALEAVVAEA